MKKEYTYLSQEGYNKLMQELDLRKKVKRKELSKAIGEAREMGDLKENAEYECAKNEQALNEKRIAELEDKLTRSRILEYENIPKDEVRIGATVKLRDEATKEEVTYTLVAADEADFSIGKISVNSPVGEGLLGHKVNSEVTIKIPAGTLRYTIVSITRP